MIPASTAQIAIELASSRVPTSRSSRRRPNSQTAATTPSAIAKPYRFKLSGPTSSELNEGLGIEAIIGWCRCQLAVTLATNSPVIRSMSSRS